MPGFLIPPWYIADRPNLASATVSTFMWGFSSACAAFTLAKAVRQTYVVLHRIQRPSSYLVMIWLEWATCIIISIINWLFMKSIIEPGFWYFFGILCLCILSVQCLMQIIINRIALIMFHPCRAKQLKWAVAGVLTVISTGVFCVWVPAQLQVNSTYTITNKAADRVQKVLFCAIDGALNFYFVYLIRSKLISAGLTKYKRLYRYNLAMIFVSLSLDVLMIGALSLPDYAVYMQAHPLAYLVKLHIEMNIAELIAKVVRASDFDGTPEPNLAYPGVSDVRRLTVPAIQLSFVRLDTDGDHGQSGTASSTRESRVET